MGWHAPTSSYKSNSPRIHVPTPKPPYTTLVKEWPNLGFQQYLPDGKTRQLPASGVDIVAGVVIIAAGEKAKTARALPNISISLDLFPLSPSTMLLNPMWDKVLQASLLLRTNFVPPKALLWEDCFLSQGYGPQIVNKACSRDARWRYTIRPCVTGSRILQLGSVCVGRQSGAKVTHKVKLIKDDE
ncbi:hypothetical protein BCR35DRAFT_335218 [Leucosporidium creatinivorum]|uniref:Uncharacterized protein n=1 Tax=Leucosporidium creatinivorum TaxID=106004 RepID=A0A1Y2DFE8_9BASI|nr:hypothetical protein BCR35DRAFT_335218 [Leucosporidium creatinivorum]